MTSIEISARAKLLSVATAIAEQYGEQESDWDMMHIWRDLFARGADSRPCGFGSSSARHGP